MKLSSYFIVTEPEKMGFPYMEAIGAAYSFSDEVVVVCGRKEKQSEEKIKSLGDKIKIINTNSWPVDWHYDHMKEHLQIGLDACTGDISLKIDVDCVFRAEKADEIRKAFLEHHTHRISIGRINFYNDDQGLFFFNRNRVIFALNKTLLQKDKITFKISNESGSNQPIFNKPIIEKYVDNQTYWPINYDNTFMSKDQIVEKWIRWYSAFAKFNEEPLKFKPEQRDEAWLDYNNYMKRKKIGSRYIEDFHPEIIKKRVEGL